MRKKLQIYSLFLLIISSYVVRGKNTNKTNELKAPVKTHNHIKEKSDDRLKRSLNDEDVRGKRQIDEQNYNTEYDERSNIKNKFLRDNEKLVKEEPFWGNRGRRDSSSIEYLSDEEYPEYVIKYCEHCSEIQTPNTNLKNRREGYISPFWGSRGRRSSNEIEDSEPFWGNRGRRQEQEPFWGNRGRRTEDSPFWGNRGRRDDEPFWGNRGRREDVEPFWGNRGRRDEAEPFWGNRGRRQDSEPFWGNRGRREDKPFWGNRGRRKVFDNNNRDRKQDLKESILKAINDVENDIDYLSRLKRSNDDPNSFWANRGRDSKLKLFFNGSPRNKALISKLGRNGKTSEPGTVLDNRMFVEEPNYILVERSSRSSAEDDPYYISRGKKYFYEYNAGKSARDRRGAIEEIVKSVRNDPYYIARGKKDTNIKINSTAHREEYIKAKELICSAIDLIMVKNESGKVKRELNDNDRDRRTILKKLAAQLQNDPYFVSRGKRSGGSNTGDYLQDFISNVAEKCN